MEWWIWILLGLALLLGELLTPGGFYIIFFGIGAIVVGTLAGFGVAGPAWFQVILFCVASVVTLGLFRGRLLQLTYVESRDDIDSLVGETAVMMEEVPVNNVGKAEMRGTSWSARNIGERTLSLGERCKVERVEGLTIFVRAEQK
ncbi:MAG: NfeD family protein [Nitrospirae bacterium]|nr:NfeD family protein [Nitrospirota bacterium]